MGYILTDTIPSYELVADVTVSVATTSVTIGGLNFGKTDDLLLVSTVASGYTGAFYLHFNGNVTGTNYYTQNLYGASTSTGASRVNESRIQAEVSGSRSTAYTKIKLTNNGYCTWQSNFTRTDGGIYPEVSYYYGTSTFTATSITSLTVTSAGSNGIGIGTRFQLYRRKATLIADTTISGSAVTSVDFTGLNLTAGNEVMLVSDWVNARASASTLNLYFNGDEITTNYYAQRIYGASTSVGAERTNYPRFAISIGNTRGFGVTNIKLTNSGYPTYQKCGTRDYGTQLEIENIYGTKTGTVSSITSIKTACPEGTYIGIGSRFQLYLLK